MSNRKNHNSGGSIAADQLLSFIQRVERLEEEKAVISEDIKEVFAQAKGHGFDTKTMKAIIKLRKMDQAERDEYEALLDIYKAALGMLGGTPLGEAALRKLSGKKEDEPKPVETPPVDEESDEGEQKKPETTIEEAREMARGAVAAGKPVTSNPFPARDPRRAAWDEEWCKSTGTDGMELPEAWRRAPKRDKDEAFEEKAA